MKENTVSAHITIKRKAFTLIELIVVVTILAILWTISFISVTWYFASARNSVRLTDISSIEKTFSLYQIKWSRYPPPTNGQGVTYSWSQIWVQGFFWEDTRRFIGTSVGRFDIPQDPTTWEEYTYSLLNTWREYQLASIFEGPIVHRFSPIPRVYAAWDNRTTYLHWNYNGKALRASTGSIDYILAVPSIVKWQTPDTNIIDIMSSREIVTDNGNVVPFNYPWAAKDNSYGEEVVNLDKIVVFSWSVYDMHHESSQESRRVFMWNLQEAYSGTLLSNTRGISQLLKLDIETEASDNLWLKLIEDHLIAWILDIQATYETDSEIADEGGDPEWEEVPSCAFNGEVTFGCSL